MKPTLKPLAGLALCILSLACQYSGISHDGPTPQIAAVNLDTHGVLTTATLLQGVVSLITVTGQGFAPLPLDVLTDHPDLAMPQVTLTTAGMSTVLMGVTYDAVTKSLSASVPAGMAVGTYDLTVKNANGKSGMLAAAVQIILPPSIDLCSSVSPAFGWVQGRTSIELCADNSHGHGLQPVPQVFLRVGPSGQANVPEVQLIRAALVSASVARPPLTDASVMRVVVPAATEARGAGLVVGGPYDLRVQNPDGSTAILSRAFTVLADPPPTISLVSPGQSDTSQTGLLLTITGTNLKDPNASRSPRLAEVLLLSQPYDPAVGCVSSSGCYPCATPTLVGNGNTQVSCNQPTGLPAGSYLVRYQHLDDLSSYELAALAVTNPAGNVSAATAATALQQGRFAHGAAYAQDDLGNRFLYVVGGQSAAATSTALASVEVAPLSLFGAVGAWQVLPVALPAAITGLNVVAKGPYLFAIGGRNSAGTPVNDVWRARVLGADTVPVIAPPTVASGGTLAAGTYSYKVSAVMGSTTDNPAGETLASDAESVQVSGAHGMVHVVWATVPGASSYRVYRTGSANQLAGTEQLLTQNITATRFDDDGSLGVSAVTPQPSGATGVWVAMPTLSTPRADAAATIAADTAGNTYVYVAGGRLSTASTETDTYDFASLTVSGGTWSTGTFTAGTNLLLGARAEAVAATLDASSAPRTSGLGEQYIVVGRGIATGAALPDLLVAKVGAAGALDAWSRPTAASSPSARRYGGLGALVSNIFYEVGGQDNSNYTASGKTTVVCSANNASCATTDPPTLSISGGNAGFTLTAPRYRGALVYQSGYFYSTGGQSSMTTVESSTDRTGFN